MAPGVRGVTALALYTVRVLFADGQVRDVDMAPALDLPVFGELRDPAVFTAVKVDDYGDTIVWPNGADLDPDVMYGEERSATDPSPRITTPILSGESVRASEETTSSTP